MKGDRGCAVHKVGTVDDITQEKRPSFKRSTKDLERPKCKTLDQGIGGMVFTKWVPSKC